MGQRLLVVHALEAAINLLPIGEIFVHFWYPVKVDISPGSLIFRLS